MPRWQHRQGGGRPPWWPEGDAWPPSAGWGRVRRYFLRRVVLFLVGTYVFFVLLSAAAGAIVSRQHPEAGWEGPPIGILVVGVIVLVVIVRQVRRTATPIGDVMEAAGRVAAGDYAARVQPAGPSEVRELAAAFNAMAERLETNERRRRDLLADVAHELRTPLSVIRGNVEGVLDGLYSAEEGALGPVVEQAEMMTRLLDDLSTLSTSEAGALSLHLESTSPGDLVAESIGAFRRAAEAKGVALESRVGAGLADLDVDPLRIGQVLSNLLSNALRHTPSAGRITVAAESVSAAAVRFSVTDTGSGISAADLPFVFDRFRKAANSGGSGLGLAIAKALVEAHSGSISASSEAGVGTTISFVLPSG